MGEFPARRFQEIIADMTDRSAVDIDDRVYQTGHDGDPDYEAPCMWWAACTNPANTVMEHPVFGDLPICKRCAEQLAHVA